LQSSIEAQPRALPWPAAAGHGAAMTTEKHMPLRLIIALAGIVASDTALQLVWKTGVAELPEHLSMWQLIVEVATEPIFFIVVGLMGAQLVIWLRVLDHADLSFAKPFTSLSYVSVCILSVVYLGERIAPLQIVGIFIVVAGVWCVGMTPRNTVRQPADRP
jgi:uncharacterized membrane protein